MSFSVNRKVFTWTQIGALVCLAGCGPYAKTSKDPMVEAERKSSIITPSEPVEDAAVARSLSEIPSIEIARKNNHIFSIDYRKCGEGWSESLELLAKLPRLEEINLDGCDIDDEAVKSLTGSKTVKRIRIPRTKVTDAGLSYLKNSTQLELLDLSDCPQISDEGFQALMGLTKLRDLSLYRTNAGDGVLKVFVGAKNLTKINFRNSKVSSQGLIDNLQYYPSLARLDLSETEIDDRALPAIAELKMLVDLNLWHTHVTDDGLAALSNTPLKRLNLDDIRHVGDAGMEHVAKIVTLEWLHVGKTNITDVGLAKLQVLANLSELVINNTAVSEKALGELQGKLVKLKSIIR